MAAVTLQVNDEGATGKPALAHRVSGGAAYQRRLSRPARSDHHRGRPRAGAGSGPGRCQQPHQLRQLSTPADKRLRPRRIVGRHAFHDHPAHIAERLTGGGEGRLGHRSRLARKHRRATGFPPAGQSALDAGKQPPPRDAVRRFAGRQPEQVY